MRAITAGVLCLVIALASLGPSAARADAAGSAPVVELYTMGPGEDLFSTFGHAAICVRDGRTPAGRCFNYGTTDFSTPLPLTWDFIRGRARFWVSVVDLPTMLHFYRRADRTIWRQVLPLDGARAAKLAAALEASTDERVKFYRYHHFLDNCTTRIRDIVDAATEGALSRASRDRGRTFREWARDGFAGTWPLLAVTELLLGRPADQRTDSWAAMFLPSELRVEVAARLGAKPEVVYARRGPPPSGSTRLGHLAFALFGLALAGVLLGAAYAPRSPRGRDAGFRVGLTLVGLALGLVGVVLWSLAVLSTFPELRRNEALAAFWPTDLLLPLLPWRWLRAYAAARLAVAALLVLGHVAPLVQPLSPLLLCVPPLVVVLLEAGRRVRA